MKRFKAVIITKKNLTKAAIAILAVSACAGVCFGIKHSEPEAVAVFSDAETILNEGMPRSDDFSIKKFIASVLGFDADKPETIIEGSSEIFKAAAETTETPEIVTDSPTEQPVAEPNEPVTDDIELPSHDEIIAATNIQIKNATQYSVDLGALCAQPLETILDKGDSPEVLIMHTHTTECYAGDEMSGEGERTTNESYNVCAVGDIIAETLEGYGISVIHDKTIHDYPSYQGAYTRAMNTINSDLETYPNVKVVLDIHRDAYVYSDGTKLRVAANVNGSDTAQVMLVLGTDSMGLYHPYWRSNLSLATKIQSAAEIMYPGLMRPIDLRSERFNMHATKGSILIEIGSNGNSLAEAKSSAGYIGNAIAAALLNG
ncbi:MAG: stage II sporulation protein P [Oscillospiraceae bacterium]|nr:stage II sporulation protein P [Oscillospiraceae bacterium]